jgi:hypothetical protein
MTNLKSSNSKPDRSVVSAMRRTLLFGISGATVLTTTLAVVFAITLDGCTSKPKNTNSNSSSLGSSKEGVQAKDFSPLPGLPIGKGSVQAKTGDGKKDSAVQRPSTVTYTDSRYGVSFRYPRKYTLMTAAKSNSAWPDPLPMNFLQPGGVTVAAIDLADPNASSLLKVSVNKGLTSEQCSKFAVPEPSSVGGNSPVNSHDDSFAPTKVSLRGVEFFEVENITDNVEARYYHRFEPGKIQGGVVEQSSCYEFALGVEESPDNTKPVDHLELFDKLERILTSVKFKSDLDSAVAANLPVKQTEGINPQQ